MGGRRVAPLTLPDELNLRHPADAPLSLAPCDGVHGEARLEAKMESNHSLVTGDEAMFRHLFSPSFKLYFLGLLCFSHISTLAQIVCTLPEY